MLSPDDLSRAGEEVAAVYRQIEDSMVDVLAGVLVSGETGSQTFMTAMQLLSQSAMPRVREVMERNREHIDGATRSEVERWLALSDSDDLSRIKTALGVELPGITSREAASVVEGVAGILSRDNLAMEQGAADAFLKQSTWAVAQVSSGAMTAHSAWREAAARLAGDGIPIVTYRNTGTGAVTVSNHADVAVRRHVRTQLSQASMSRTLQVCRDAGIGFVEVSSHAGARPTHAEWHGRVYSLDGDVTVDGRRYRDFWRGTGYQGKEGPYASLADQLGGVNCRHTFGPWLPGTPRAYDPDPQHPSGLSNDEVYELEQRQRAQERRIRATKRELMVARGQAVPGNVEDTVRVARLEAKLKRQQANMRKLIDDANGRSETGARVLTRSHPSESVAGYRPNPVNVETARFKLLRGEYSSSQEEIDSILKNELKGIQFITQPRYDARIKTPGRTVRHIDSDGRMTLDTRIGKQYKPGKEELIDTIIHEELEARIMANKHGAERYYALDAADNDTRHAYIDKIIARYVKLKRL